MATTKVLLREDIDTLGGRGEIVKVRAGYARNYLLPQGMASLATKGNLKQIENERTALLKKAAVERSTAEAQADADGRYFSDVRPQSRRNRTSVRFGDFDGYCRSLKRKRLRN